MSKTTRAIVLTAFACLALYLLLMFALPRCGSDPDPIGALAESRADSARIASDAAHEWRHRAGLISDSLEVLKIAYNQSRYAEAQAIRAADESSRRARSSDREATELYEQLAGASTARDTALALSSCTDARIGLGEALTDCETAQGTLLTSLGIAELSIEAHEEKDVVQDSAFAFQFTAFTGMEEAYDLRTIQVTGLRGQVRSLTFQRYLYAAGAFAAGYGLAQLTGQ